MLKRLETEGLVEAARNLLGLPSASSTESSTRPQRSSIDIASG